MTRKALEDHIPILSGGHHAILHGWVVEMGWETGLCHVQMTCPFGAEPERVNHIYMLQISFDRYPIEQPGVRFVDPKTRCVGEPAEFEHWWPNVDGNPWINVQIDSAQPAKSYLCFQWTQEFRQTHSAPEANDPKRWDAEKHTVAGVASMVQRALKSPFYKGYRKQ